jgi:hypothetical protein
MPLFGGDAGAGEDDDATGGAQRREEVGVERGHGVRIVET